MTDTFNKIKEELSLYYPDVTDDDVEKLITFFKLSAKAVHASQKSRGSILMTLMTLNQITFNIAMSEVIKINCR